MMTDSLPQPAPPPAVRADTSGWAVVTLAGEQNAAVGDLARTALIEADALGGGRVIVDLTGATATGSVVLGLLISAVRRAGRHPGGAVRLVGADERLTAKLRITGMHRILPTYPDLQAATKDEP